MSVTTNKVEKINEFIIPSGEIVFDDNFVKDLKERLHCRFDGDEFKQIFESLKDKKITLPEDHFTVYDKLNNSKSEKVMDALWEQGIKAMDFIDKEKILRNIKFFIENNSNSKILLTDNWYTHLGFYQNEKKEDKTVYNIKCQRHHDSNEWIFWIDNKAAETKNTQRAIVQTAKDKESN